MPFLADETTGKLKEITILLEARGRDCRIYFDGEDVSSSFSRIEVVADVNEDTHIRIDGFEQTKYPATVKIAVGQ